MEKPALKTVSGRIRDEGGEMMDEVRCKGGGMREERRGGRDEGEGGEG